MNCETSRDRLHDQIDGTLDPVIEGELEQHLAGCASCRGFASDLAAIADAAAAMPAIDVPERVWLQLAGRWRAQQAAAGGQPA
ncbi:MAG: zf-HC2 domain-containing protein, partial [Acidobacteriota bacterium]|nr:zf-HC2 domain-containing protein [Acidobacteriota bacterium]